MTYFTQDCREFFNESSILAQELFEEEFKFSDACPLANQNMVGQADENWWMRPEKVSPRFKMEMKF